jgi:peptide/nickel transport system permease protein
VQLGLVSWLLGVIVGISLGTVSAVRRNSPIDMAVTTFAISGVAIPHFWLGMMLIVVFAVWLGWLPYGGFNASLFTSPLLWMQQMLLPTFVLGTGLAAILMRQTRAALLEVFREPYILTARAKGLKESRVIWGHAMKNSLLPVVTIASLQFLKCCLKSLPCSSRRRKTMGYKEQWLPRPGNSEKRQNPPPGCVSTR